VTVCDNAAGEVCPIWPGKPLRTHWCIPDPAAVTGPPAVIAAAFADAYRMMCQRIELLLNLLVEELDSLTLKHKMDSIAQTPTMQEPA
jgi:protein-tyrosine-phosphatase